MDIVRLTVHKITIFSRSGPETGPILSNILDEELRKLNGIETLINRIIVFRGYAATGELDPAREQELAELSTELLLLWNNAATLDYLRGFDRQVLADVFF